MSCACIWPAKWRNRPKPRLFSCVCVCVCFLSNFFSRLLRDVTLNCHIKYKVRKNAQHFNALSISSSHAGFSPAGLNDFFVYFWQEMPQAAPFFFFFCMLGHVIFFFLSRAFLAITRKILRFPPPPPFFYESKRTTPCGFLASTNVFYFKLRNHIWFSG